MPDLTIRPLRYDPSAALAASSELTEEHLRALYPRLEQQRAAVLAEAQAWRDGVRVRPPDKDWDPAFHELPERLLTEFDRGRNADSELARLLSVGRALAAAVDRVVVLGIGGSYMGARALLESCCHPYFNELHRGERGGFPRMYFEGNNLDTDAMQGLLDLLTRRQGISSDNDRWGLVVISKSGKTLETAVALRVFLEELARSNGGQLYAGDVPLVVPVTGREQSRLRDLMLAYGVQERDFFDVPEGVGGRFSVFSAVGLLPAVLLGLDIVKLLEGAAAMNEHFRTAPPEENLVLRHVGVAHLAEQRLGATVRILSTWGKSLEAVGLWYDQLLAESLGKNEQGATPLTVVNTRDLHSRGQQHQEGRRDKLITNVIVDEPRRRLEVPRHSADRDQDKLNALSSDAAARKTVADCLSAAIAGTNAAYREARRPTADLHLPRCDEPAIGQLLQMLMLATVVEGRLIGINPYGQPGVEAYKKHMNKFLGL